MAEWVRSSAWPNMASGGGELTRIEAIEAMEQGHRIRRPAWGSHALDKEYDEFLRKKYGQKPYANLPNTDDYEIVVPEYGWEGQGL